MKLIYGKIMLMVFLLIGLIIILKMTISKTITSEVSTINQYEIIKKEKVDNMTLYIVKDNITGAEYLIFNNYSNIAITKK